MPASLIAAVSLLAISATSAAHALDRSGKVQKGVASYYGPGFAGKKTASGKPMKPGHMTAASPTLPLGTKAKVTNRENGRSAHVTVTDRGPYAKGRIIDVSPKAAEQLDMKDDGVAPVKVQPTELPPEKPQH
jgi:rare lipoprotein A